MVTAKQVSFGVCVFAFSVLFVLGALFGVYKAATNGFDGPTSSALLHATRFGFNPCAEVPLDKPLCFTLVIFSHTTNEALRDELAITYANDSAKRDFCFEPLVVVFNGQANNFITSRIEQEYGRPSVTFERVSPAFLALFRKKDHPYVTILDSFAPHPRQLRQIVSDQTQTWNCTLRYCSVFERLFSPTACGSNCVLSLSPAVAGCAVSTAGGTRRSERFDKWSFAQEVQNSLFSTLLEGSSVYEVHRERSGAVVVHRTVRHHRLYYRPSTSG